MRILIPNFCLDDSFVDNVAFTLEQMGHEVVHMGSISVRKSYSKIYRAVKDIQGKIFPQMSAQEKFILETVKNTKFDLMISLTQSLDDAILFECQKKGILTVSWWGDPAANMTKRGVLSEYWDFVYIKDAYAANKVKSLGINAEQLLEAMNPAWHKPTHQQSNNELVIAGSFYDYRQFITKKLIEDKVELGLYGPTPPNWAYKEIKENHTGKFITKHQKSEIFGSGLGILNSSPMREFDSVNCRAFEIAGCAGLHILENRKSIESCFEPGKEVLTYDSYEELLEILDKAKRFPNQMKQIREAGAIRAHSDHTYEIRLNYILSKI